MEDKIWYLKDINVLKSLKEGDLMRLGAVCSMMQYRKGESIYMFEDTTNVFFLKSGSVKVMSVDADGNNHVQELLEAGEIFGKFIDEQADRQLKVIAAEDCLVCYLPFEKWQDFIKDHPALSLSFIKWAGSRIKRLENKVDSLYFKPSRQRIAEKLMDTIKRFGKKDESGNVIVSLSLTHDEIAQLTGTSRQNVNTYLNELREKGLNDYDRTSINVKPAYFQNEMLH
ncbi:MAG: Crp/Fnr family transcriptional regulator [Cyclobacteriaceae bacterium]|nr:Crp/Fnr family transcriptional regulator [Cyclobacteriaceae bacterium]